MSKSRAPAEPGRAGRFGEYGGSYVPETLLGPVLELAAAYNAARKDPAFAALVETEGRDFAGRPTPLLPAPRLGAAAKLSRVYLKREDLLHTGAHKINNAIGQALLAKRMGKTRLVAETGPDSTVSRPRRRPRAMGSRASSTWDRWTWSGSIRTSSGCDSSAPRS